MKVIAISGWKRSGKDTAANYLIDRGYKRIGFADPLKDMVAKEYDIPREHCDDPEFKEKPILHLPVSPKDAFTLGVAKLMFKEFRGANGQIAMDYEVDASGAFLGVLNYNKGIMSDPSTLGQLYWTPRALCILKGSINRAVRSDYWVQAAINKIEEMSTPNKALEDTYGPGYGVTNYFVISDLRYQSEVTQLKEAFGKSLVTVRVNRFETSQSTDPSERDLDNAKFDVVLDNKGSLEDFLIKVDKLNETVQNYE